QRHPDGFLDVALGFEQVDPQCLVALLLAPDQAFVDVRAGMSNADGPDAGHVFIGLGAQTFPVRDKYSAALGGRQMTRRKPFIAHACSPRRSPAAGSAYFKLSARSCRSSFSF